MYSGGNYGEDAPIFREAVNNILSRGKGGGVISIVLAGKLQIEASDLWDCY